MTDVSGNEQYGVPDVHTRTRAPNGELDPGIGGGVAVPAGGRRAGGTSTTASSALLVGGSVTAALSLLHVGIVLGGAEWYRFFGAGERMARLAARGALAPAVLTLGIAVVLALWALYAFSGAGLIRRLPLLRPALALVAIVYLARGVLGLPVVLLGKDPYSLELQERVPFMVVTSAVSLVLGLCYAAGGLAALRFGAEGPYSDDAHGSAPS